MIGQGTNFRPIAEHQDSIELKPLCVQTHRVSVDHIRIVDHCNQVDDGEGGVEHVGAEEVLMEGDPLAAQTPA